MILGPLMEQVQVPAERVTSMAFSPAGASLALACWGGAVCLYHASRSASSGRQSLIAALQAGAASAAGRCTAQLGAEACAGDKDARMPAAESAAAAALQAQVAPLQEEPEAELLPDSGGNAGGRPGATSAPEQPAGEAGPLPGLADIDHGVKGTGGWAVGCRCA
jgi:hypothetical protein